MLLNVAKSARKNKIYIILCTWMSFVIAEFAEWITECDQLWKEQHQIWTIAGLWGEILALKASYAGEDFSIPN